MELQSTVDGDNFTVVCKSCDRMDLIQNRVSEGSIDCGFIPSHSDKREFLGSASIDQLTRVRSVTEIDHIEDISDRVNAMDKHNCLICGERSTSQLDVHRFKCGKMVGISVHPDCLFNFAEKCNHVIENLSDDILVAKI